MTRRQLASLATCLTVSLGACTSEEGSGADRDSAPSVSRPTDASENADFQGRRPKVWVVFSGRIAYPNVSLTTWSTCAFEIERVYRVDESTMRVVGRESDTKCSSRVRRWIVSERLTKRHAHGGEVVDRVVVVGRDPHFVVQAVVQHGIA